MQKFIDALKKVLPESNHDQLSSVENAPAAILAFNVNFLMKVRGIKSNQALRDKIMEVSGFDLSTSHIGRIRKAKSDSTGLTILKLGHVLCSEPSEYHFLYDVNGFDKDGKAIGRYLDLDEPIFQGALSDAYTSLSTVDGEININKMIAMALVGYRAQVSNDFSNLQIDLLNAMKEH